MVARHSGGAPRTAGVSVLHEMSIVESVLDQVRSEVEQAGQSGRVVGLHLVIGRLSGVHADSIRFAFELLAPESIAAGAQLTIDQPRARLHCRCCATEHEIEELAVVCPHCGDSRVTILGGQELMLQSIDLEEDL